MLGFEKLLGVHVVERKSPKKLRGSWMITCPCSVRVNEQSLVVPYNKVATETLAIPLFSEMVRLFSYFLFREGQRLTRRPARTTSSGFIYYIETHKMKVRGVSLHGLTYL